VAKTLVARFFLGASIALSLVQPPLAVGSSLGAEIVVSVADQELALVARGKTVAPYPISTSKFGIGDGVGTYQTPLGTMFVSAKVGEGLPAGAVIKSRMATGEVLAANAPGRDPIVSRVLWLRGKEDRNRNARERCIYIHGTAEERRIGKRASFGCIRMKSKDVIALYAPRAYRHAGYHFREIARGLATAGRGHPPRTSVLKLRPTVGRKKFRTDLASVRTFGAD
jgi:hypothetical protein